MNIHHAERVRCLNDAFRRSFLGGRASLPWASVPLASSRWRTSAAGSAPSTPLPPDNDPYQEHDFGAFDEGGVRMFWKIDCFDAEMEYASPNPADPKVTTRVIDDHAG